MFDAAFKVVAWRKGDHWRLSQNERDELAVAAMNASKALPVIPEEKIGKYGSVIVFALMTGAIVQARTDEDQRIRTRQNPALRPPAQQARPAPAVTLPPEVQRLVDEGRAEIVTMTPEEYAAQLAARNGDADYPTVGVTHETLLDEIIDATQGVDQGTLAEHARASGRLSD